MAAWKGGRVRVHLRLAHARGDPGRSHARASRVPGPRGAARLLSGGRPAQRLRVPVARGAVPLLRGPLRAGAGAPGRGDLTLTAPLSGIRVLEVGQFMAAPFCTMQLADLGADVVKVESPRGGDSVRGTGPFIDGESSPFLRLNRNKRSLALDLKAPRGAEVLWRLVERADILVENLRPGTFARLGFPWEELHRRNPGLISVVASGWGQDGPLAQLAGLDIMAQARSGLMSITGQPGGDPVKVGVPMCDLVCALYGALAAVSALHARDRTGEGQRIDVSLFEAGVSFSIWEAGRYFATGEIPQPQGSAHQANAPYQAVRTEDGWVTIGASTERNWRSFCEALDLTALLEDDRYRTSNTRLANRDSLIATIEERTTRASTAHWTRVLEAAGVPCAPIQNYAQVYSDAHLLARDYFWDAPHPRDATEQVRQLGSPMRFSATPARRDAAGPLLGEHSEAVLSEAGLTAQEIADLLEEGIAQIPQEDVAAR
ncbi:MAG: CoA transferase [Candidatus Dormibacteraeota bacterium]|nr:CoA transferase [Candidatus Dormibacteraeota bacterium]